MSNPGNSDIETVLIRQASLSVIIHGLIDCMVAKSLLDESDLTAIRCYALNMATDLQNAAGSEARAAGIRIAEEVESFLKVVTTI